VPSADALAAAAGRFPDRVAIVDGGHRVTFASLNDQAGRASAVFRALGVGAGDRVAVLLPNSSMFVSAYFGVLRLGATVVPLNPLLTRAEVVQQLGDAHVAVVVVHEEATALEGGDPSSLAGDEATVVVVEARPDGATLWAPQPALEATAEPRPDDLAVILYTSGSTGVPKGVEITHGNLAAAAIAHRGPFELNEARPDTFLAAVPLAHAFGLASVLLPWLDCAGTLVIVRRFDAGRTLDLIASENVTFLAAVPAMLARMSEIGTERPLRVVLSGEPRCTTISWPRCTRSSRFVWCRVTECRKQRVRSASRAETRRIRQARRERPSLGCRFASWMPTASPFLRGPQVWARFRSAGPRCRLATGGNTTRRCAPGWMVG
jgi:acyl-CoA synthetase (AMP-forming)/AMP-acid ligase II